MANKEMRQWLASQQGMIDSAKEAASAAPTYEMPPDGNYVLDLLEAEFGQSQAGRRQIKWVWEIVECADESWIGKKKYNYTGLEDDRGWKFLMQDLKKMGVNIDTVKAPQLPDVIESLVDFGLRINAQLKRGKNNSDFQNLYIKSVVSDDSPVPQKPAAAKPTTVDVGDRISYNWEGSVVEGNVAQFNDAMGLVTIRSGRATREIAIEDVISVL